MFCKNCGSELREGALFCPNCGNKVAQVEDKISNNVPIKDVTIESDKKETVKESVGKFDIKKYIPIIVIVVVFGIIGVFGFGKTNSGFLYEGEISEEKFINHFRKTLYSLDIAVIPEGSYGIRDNNYFILGEYSIKGVYIIPDESTWSELSWFDVKNNCIVDRDTGARESLPIKGLASKFNKVPVGTQETMDVVLPKDFKDEKLAGKSTVCRFERYSAGEDGVKYIEVTPGNITDEYVERYFSKEYGISTVEEFFNFVEQDYINKYN